LKTENEKLDAVILAEKEKAGLDFLIFGQLFQMKTFA